MAMGSYHQVRFLVPQRRRSSDWRTSCNLRGVGLEGSRRCLHCIEPSRRPSTACGSDYLDFQEASTAGYFLIGRAAAGAGDFHASGWVHAPAVSGGRVMLFGFVVAVFGACRRVETWHA